MTIHARITILLETIRRIIPGGRFSARAVKVACVPDVGKPVPVRVRR